MSRAAIVVTALMLSVAPTVTLANEQGAVAGAATGAVAGAIVGGPIGAAIGAVVGGAAGGIASGPNQDAIAVEEPGVVPQRRLAPVAPAGRVMSYEEPAVVPERRIGGPVAPRALPYEPEATGSIIETTCVRDTRGVARCRREAVQ
jgi:hypothetical protein